MPHPTAVALDLDGVVWRAFDCRSPAPSMPLPRSRAAGVTGRVRHEQRRPDGRRPRGEAGGARRRRGRRRAHQPDGGGDAAAAGERVLVAGGPGDRRGGRVGGRPPVSYEAVDAGAAVDVVVAASTATSTGSGCGSPSTAVRDGARFVATNDDATYPTETGLVPGAGAIVGEHRHGVRRGPDDRRQAARPDGVRCCSSDAGPTAIVVGDRADTDGALARRVGWRFALVLSGVTSPPGPPRRAGARSRGRRPRRARRSAARVDRRARRRLAAARAR